MYVSLTTFLGFGENYVEGYFQKTGNAVFLHIRREKHEVGNQFFYQLHLQLLGFKCFLQIPSEQIGEGPEKKITRLAIGVEGGFDPESGRKKFEYKDNYSIVVFPQKERFPYPDERLPLMVREFEMFWKSILVWINHV